MKSKYRSPFSVDYRKPIIIDEKDRRTGNFSRYRSKIGSKLIIRDAFKNTKPLDLEEYTE